MQKLSIKLSFISLFTRITLFSLRDNNESSFTLPEELYCESSTTRQSLCQSKDCKM
ncbi:hypothetical protein BDZ91DRAFT_734345 [Kalaharituber pfeilii]|nr:hypothetical protein BDZ91DRAFT_734345 [Kalaharituber pfeilii]